MNWAWLAYGVLVLLLLGLYLVARYHHPSPRKD